MTDGVTFDFAQITKLAADLGTAPVKAGANIRKAIEVTARNIKDGWAKDLAGTADVPHGSRTITYDIKAGDSAGGGGVGGLLNASAGLSNVISAEIGAEDGRLQAPIVTVIEFGAPTKNLAPRGYGAGELQKFQGDFQHGLELAIQDPL